MSIFTRYVVSEVLKLFFLALLGLTLLVTVGMGVKEGLSRGLPPAVIAKTLPWTIPEILGITIPVGMLFAVTSVFHRMSGANEFVAIKAMGISPLRILMPVLMTASLLSLATVCLYEIAATWCRPMVQQVVGESLEEITYGVLQTERSFSANNFAVTVRRVDGKSLIAPTITIKGRRGEPAATLVAERAELYTDYDRQVLVITCYNGEFRVGSELHYAFPELRQEIPLDHYEPRVHRDWLGCAEIPEHVARMRVQKDAIEARLAVNPNDAKAQADLKSLTREMARLETEPYRRWANGFSCLCFALVGAPVAMIFRYGDALGSFFICFLPILVTYYPLLMMSEDLSTSGALPPIAFWTANVAITIPGLWLLRAALRH